MPKNDLEEIIGGANSAISIIFLTIFRKKTVSNDDTVFLLKYL